MFRSLPVLLTTLTLALAVWLPARSAEAREPGDAARQAADLLLPEAPTATLVGPWDGERAETLPVDDEPTSTAEANEPWHRTPEER